MCTTPRESRSLKRLKSLASTKDGFEIAKIDLEERREGELLNIAQSGKNNLCFADPIKMPELVETARNAALEVIKEDPLLKLHKNTGLKRSLDYIYCAGVVVEFGA
jgi:ATP-dependent DNA helicase RecG